MPVYRTTPIYSEQIIIGATLIKFSPKKIKLFVWPLEPGEEIIVPPVAPPEIPPEIPPPAGDTTPPGNVVLSCSGSANFVLSETITCTWTNPPDADFKESIVYVNNAEVLRVPKGQPPQYQKTGITSNVPSQYSIKIYTKDNTGNINQNAGSKSCGIQESYDKTKFRAIC